MSTNVTYTTDATLNTIRAKTSAFLRDAVDVTVRNRIAFPLLKKWGGLMLGIDVSWARIWNAKNALPETEPWLDSPDQDYASGPEQQQYILDVGGYITKDRMSEQEYERNRGSRTQIVNIYTEKAADVQQSMSNRLNSGFLHDTGVNNTMTGLDVLFSGGAAVPATDIVAAPGGAYAGQSLSLGVNGTWTTTAGFTSPSAATGTDWPENPVDGSSLYDWNSPLELVRNGQWPSGPVWSANCFDVLRYYTSVQKNRGGKVVDPTAEITYVMGERSHREFRTAADARNYRMEPVQDAINIGMPTTVRFENCWLTYDSDVQADYTYCLQPDMMEFYTSPGFKDIWKLDGPYEFKPELTNLYCCRTLGNYRFGSAKFFGRIRDF